MASDYTDPVLEQTASWLREGKDVALAFVARTWGSSPFPVGSLLSVTGDGSFSGSVSAGCVENAVIEGAREVIERDRPATLTFTVSKEDALEVGLSCGGRLEVLVARVLDPSVILTVCDRHATRQFVCLSIDPQTGGMAVQPYEGDSDCGYVTNDANEPVFVRPFHPSPRLFVFGAGHIAQALVPMAQTAGIDVFLIDPRTAFLNEERFPTARRFPVWPDTFFGENPPDAHTAVVTLVHDPKIDDPALEAAIKSDAFYIGALGSRKTHAKRLDRLRERGYSEAVINRVHGPVGLDLGGRTPAEIAVSILAQIVQARHHSGEKTAHKG